MSPARSARKVTAFLLICALLSLPALAARSHSAEPRLVRERVVVLFVPFPVLPGAGLPVGAFSTASYDTTDSVASVSLTPMWPRTVSYDGQ